MGRIKNLERRGITRNLKEHLKVDSVDYSKLSSGISPYSIIVRRECLERVPEDPFGFPAKSILGYLIKFKDITSAT